MDKEKQRQSIIRCLEFLRDSTETLLSAVDPEPVDPDCDMDDLWQLLIKVNPLVGEYMQASFGEGNGG